MLYICENLAVFVGSIEFIESESGQGGGSIEFIESEFVCFKLSIVCEIIVKRKN